eukprot:CAMPEP_0202972034 /NCGR_PEP_ID=MMETSP1396-20130829/32842_1 /ASSEMBLY_ACC=CAM_ASM_000872 /TAXON_ID= /ORGANISM="Pseudokeronopsis sp., Strain Brazil" /LENGTH=152 /DNA_ID=CAMNT_0049702029 /DNA_START=93 /DNA_END=551 /DNA_ORIENTATION=+
MTHSTSPPVGKECLCCMEDISAENYAEYLPHAHEENPNPSWIPAQYCQTCIEYLLQTQFQNFKDAWQKTTCKAEQRRLVTRGPPINLRDDKAMPCPGKVEINLLWYMSDGQEKSAKLLNSLEGEERERYWDELRAFYSEDEPDDEATSAGDA